MYLVKNLFTWVHCIIPFIVPLEGGQKVLCEAVHTVRDQSQIEIALFGYLQVGNAGRVSKHLMHSTVQVFEKTPVLVHCYEAVSDHIEHRPRVGR